MQVRRVLYFLALMMSVASVCMAAAEAGKPGSSSSASSNSVDKCLPPPENDADNIRETPRDITKYYDEQRRSNASAGSDGNDVSVNPPPPPPSPVAEPPASPPIAAGGVGEGSNGSSPSEGPTGANVNNPAGEGAVNAESTATAQPTSPSPESSDTETANGSGTANDGGSSTPAGSESSNNPTDEESTITTTTTNTTNTIPIVPVISNNTIMPNVKGDADSSSSISSSVWVRVPLLIVVTLACILVC
ncbi:uncharacterized protein TM35_000511310 [Trypanosoma theileri]|uniref:Mucin-associated surface protein (MASP) n=1 Tax=Trypanosoma theileri TaxID=67003 RepID=A0A1X0NIU8_9TRYP|nr:uncharacterized protein TM35_000511310 [Trypanosoma theileri]ORC84030.1 hypothetical protein TM35_000511310 [Trypanosoma theileri]